jgi:hypothetical protein
MESVVNLLGKPDEKLNAVGHPPITRWVYTNYILYFENNVLLHAVENRALENKALENKAVDNK